MISGQPRFEPITQLFEPITQLWQSMWSRAQNCLNNSMLLSLPKAVDSEISGVCC